MNTLTKNTDICLSRMELLDTVVYRIVNRSVNQELLKTVPSSPIDDDLVKIFYLTAVQTEKFYGNLIITDALMENFGITLAELEEYAEENTPRLHKPTLKEIQSVMENLFEDTLFPDPGFRMWVLSNEDNMYGASTIFYDGLLECISEMLGSDLYIIPSSIHETLILKAPLPFLEDVVQNQIREVNSNPKLVRMDEVLSNKLYYYKRHSNQISVV